MNAPRESRQSRQPHLTRQPRREPRKPRSWAARAYEGLLRTYPPRYRARFGQAMRDTFLHDHARVRARGRGALVPFWLVTVAHALWFGARERVAQIHWSPRTDVRYALRLLARSPLFAATSIASLAIGIAASTIVFGVADALFFTAAPGIRDPDRVVDIARTTNGAGDAPLSYTIFHHLREHARTLESTAVASRTPVPLNMTGEAGSERVYGRTVSHAFFDVLRVRPALGRFFRADEDEVVGPRAVVVLSHRFWRERLRSDPRVLDRPLRLNNLPFTVIGVAEVGFDSPTIIGTDLWVPIAIGTTLRGAPRADRVGDPDAAWPGDERAIARLKPGVAREAARAELNTLLAALRADQPSAIPPSFGIGVDPGGRLPPRARPQFAAFVALLSCLAGGLLAIACSNVGGLLLARATTRRTEMATRLAMGASRGQLIGQMLIETLLLFVAAACLALPLVLWLTSALRTFIPTTLPLPIVFDLPITARTGLFTLGVSLVTGVLFGLAPARHALRTDLSRMLQAPSSTASRDRVRLRQGLVAAQVALSLALIITAGLFVRTLQAASRIDPGFTTVDVDVVTLDTSLADAASPDRDPHATVPRVERLVERLRAIGGVEAVGHARVVPLEGNSASLGAVRLSGDRQADAHGAPPTGGGLTRADWDVVSPSYFETIGLSMVDGRAFTTADRDGRPLVAIVNETFARTAWPGQRAVGQRFWQAANTTDVGRPLDVVGVVRDARYRSIDEAPRPLVYVPFAQQPQSHVELFVKHAAGRSVAREVRAAIQAVEPQWPIVVMRSFDEATAVTLLPQRFVAWVAGAVGGVGLLLAALGLYGVAAFLVAQRTREIALRIALGASRREVRAMVLGQAARLGLVGAAVGLALAVALGRLVQHLGLLIDVPSTDPATFGGLALFMTAVLFVATDIPARRAAATDAAAALRAP